MQDIEDAMILFKSLKITPNQAERIGLKVKKDGKKRTAFDLLGQSPENIEKMKLIWPDVVNVDFRVINQLSNIAKYEVYIDRQKAEVEAIKKYESIKIPNDLEYKKIKGLSNEILTKLELIRPTNLLQASRIEGVTPAAMTLLNLHIKRKRLFQKEKNLLQNSYVKKSA